MTGPDENEPESRVFYFSAYVRVEAVTEDEAWARISNEPAYTADGDMAEIDGDDRVQLVVDELLESDEIKEDETLRCLCPPGLVARGGFRSVCPVHGVWA